MRPLSSGTKRKKRSSTPSPWPRPGALPVVAELKRDAEVVLAQRAHRGLQFVFRRRAHAHLIGLNRRLHLLQLLVLDELDDLARGFDRDALLDRNHATDGAASRRLRLRRLEILDGDAAPDQPGLDD